MFIAIYDDTHAFGKTLTEAYKNLNDNIGGVEFDGVEFYDASDRLQVLIEVVQAVEIKEKAKREIR